MASLLYRSTARYPTCASSLKLIIVRSSLRGLATAVPVTNPPKPPSKLRMIILGAPGAGKGTQTERVLAKWNIDTLGVGDLLRQEVNKKTSLGKQAEKVMKAGGLLPDDLVLKLIEPGMEALRDKSWVLDGFPRKASQAKLLDELLSKSSDELNLVVSLNVPDRVILGRIQDRWIHAPSGRLYNNSYNPPKTAGKDDVTGEALTKRADDNEETFARRLKSFHEENDPLLEHYKQQTVPTPPVTESDDGVVDRPKLVILSGETSDQITPQLMKIMKERFPELTEK